jgi:hypothetical protein
LPVGLAEEVGLAMRGEESRPAVLHIEQFEAIKAEYLPLASHAATVSLFASRGIFS